MDLSQQEKIRFAKIIFNTDEKQKQEIDSLTIQQLQKVRTIYAQKIVFQAVNWKIQTFPDDQPNEGDYRGSRIPNFFTTFLFFLFPEQNREFFDITTAVFLKRAFSPFIFWNNKFLQINQGKTQYYGFIWLMAAYFIIMSMGSILNRYFVQPANYMIQYKVFIHALGMILIFKVVEPLIYTTIVGCLGGYISSNQSLMLAGYSLVLYFLPTFFCLVPSLYWHICMLGGSSFFRAIFLYRNYQTKLQTKGYIILIVIVIVQIIYMYLTIKILFWFDVGYGFSHGFANVFSSQPQVKTNQSSQVSEHKEAHLLFDVYKLQNYFRLLFSIFIILFSLEEMEEELTPWQDHVENHVSVVRKSMDYLNESSRRYTIIRQQQQKVDKQSCLAPLIKPLAIPQIRQLKQKKDRLSQSQLIKKSRKISANVDQNFKNKPIFLLPQLSLYRSKFARRPFITEISNFQIRYNTQESNTNKQYYLRTMKNNSNIQQTFPKGKQKCFKQIQQLGQQQKGLRKYNLFKK